MLKYAADPDAAEVGAGTDADFRWRFWGAGGTADMILYRTKRLWFLLVMGWLTVVEELLGLDESRTEMASSL